MDQQFGTKPLSVRSQGQPSENVEPRVGKGAYTNMKKKSLAQLPINVNKS